MKQNRFFRKKIDSFDVTKCFKKIEIPDLYQMCAPFPGLPSKISTMGSSASDIQFLLMYIKELSS